MTKQISAYGSWPSAINSQLLTQGMKRLSEPQLEGDHCYWLESRPEEKGRTQVVCRHPDGSLHEVTPPDVNVRSRIHEYGGGSYRAHKGSIYYVNDKDQRIYQLDTLTNNTPQPLTPEGQYRYSDFCIDDERQQLICVCEIHHQEREAENCIIAVKLDGSSVVGFNLLVFGNDFYSNPRVSPDGTYLSWLTWKHPNMPWDNSECYLAEFSPVGLMQKQRKVAGGSDDGARNESIFQPQWSPTGELFFVSDRNQWWNLYRYQPNTKTTTAVFEVEAEFATPQWVFGMSTYGFLNSFTVFCCYTQQGRWHAATIDTLTSHVKTLALDYNSVDAISCNEDSDTAVFVGANDTTLEQIIQWHDQQTTTLATSGKLAVAVDELSSPEAITFNNNHGHAVHGFYYPPQNARYTDTASALPPLLVMCHGGPTGATRSALNLKIQYWTNKGFAVFDINYSGSTGYGRPYRDRLKGQWGVLDVDDICAGADHLVQQGLVDSQRVAVRGSSAGGYSVLAALTFRNSFTAGASLYGIGDLRLLAEDTHKFESRYLDQLIGPYPEAAAVYRARSPLHHVDQLHCPVIFLQGLEDKVVPPSQAEAMVNALAEKNIPVAYATFADEGHGFRNADNIRYALDVEYAFYCQIFQLKPSTSLVDVPFVVKEKH